MTAGRGDIRSEIEVERRIEIHAIVGWRVLSAVRSVRMRNDAGWRSDVEQRDGRRKDSRSITGFEDGDIDAAAIRTHRHGFRAFAVDGKVRYDLARDGIEYPHRIVAGTG